MNKKDSSFPDFIIIGAMKSATTTLADIISRHPQICFSVLKEPEYFVDPTVQRVRRPNSKLPLDPVERAKAYRQLFRRAHARQTITGEASTMYFACEEAPSLVRAANEHAKLIAVLRNPIKRAASAFNYMRSTGEREPQTSLLTAATEDISGARGDWWPAYRYVWYGHYDIHLRRWLDHFDRSQVLVTFAEDMRADPSGFVRRVLDFIGADSSIELNTSLVSNRTSYPNSIVGRSLSRFIHRPLPLKTAIKAVSPFGVRRFLRKRAIEHLAASGSAPPALSAEERDVLAAAYAGTADRLAALASVPRPSW